MSRPITWETVKGPDPNQAVQSMGLAAATIDKGFGGLVSAFDKYKTETKDRNTLEFMSELAKYQSPEALQTAMADGTIANLQQKYGSMLNSEVATAPTDMLGKVLQQAVVKGQHDDANTRRDQISLINQLAFLSNSDPQAAAEFIKANPGLLDASQFADDMRATRDSNRNYELNESQIADQKSRNAYLNKLTEAQVGKLEREKNIPERLKELDSTIYSAAKDLSTQYKRGYIKSNEYADKLWALRDDLLSRGYSVEEVGSGFERFKSDFAGEPIKVGPASTEKANFDARAALLNSLGEQRTNKYNSLLGLVKDRFKDTDPEVSQVIGENIDLPEDALQRMLAGAYSAGVAGFFGGIQIDKLKEDIENYKKSSEWKERQIIEQRQLVNTMIDSLNIPGGTGKPAETADSGTKKLKDDSKDSNSKPIQPSYIDLPQPTIFGIPHPNIYPPY